MKSLTIKYITVNNIARELEDSTSRHLISDLQTQVDKSIKKVVVLDKEYTPNNGTINIDNVITLHLDISNKANKDELIIKNTNSSDKKTIQLKQGLLTDVIINHLDISGKANSEDLSKVALSGNYNDLLNKPVFKTINNNSIIAEEGGNNNIVIEGGDSSISVTDLVSYGSQAVVQSGAVYNALLGKLDTSKLNTINGQNLYVQSGSPIDIKVPTADNAGHLKYDLVPRTVLEGVNLNTNLINSLKVSTNEGKTFHFSDGRILCLYKNSQNQYNFQEYSNLDLTGSIYYNKGVIGDSTPGFYLYNGPSMAIISSNGGSSLEGYCNIKRLEDFICTNEGEDAINYSDVTTGELPFLILSNLSSINTTEGIRDYISTFESTNAQSILKASKNRKFILWAIDHTLENEVLMFPKNQTFYIDFSWVACHDSFVDYPRDYDARKVNKPYLNDYNGKHYGCFLNDETYYSDVTQVTVNNCHYLPDFDKYWFKDNFQCLTIRKRVNINLNGCTIKVIPNWIVSLYVIDIGMGKYFSGWKDNFGNPKPSITDPAGTIITNGTIDLNWNRMLKFGKVNCLPNYRTLDSEHHSSCVHANCKVHLEDLILHNSPADGLIIGSNYQWGPGNDPEFFNFDSSTGTVTINKGYIGYKGSHSNITYTNETSNEYKAILLILNGYIKDQSNSNNYSGWVYSNPILIAPHVKNVPYCNVYVRPSYYTENSEGIVDNNPYWVSEYFTVAYYSDAGGTVPIENSTLILKFKDPLTIPNNAVSMRFSVKRDPAYDSEMRFRWDEDELEWKMVENRFLKLMVYVSNYAYGSEVKNCKMYDCSRDGITLGSLPNGIILNCEIYNCGQCSIDIESTGYFDYATIFDGLKCGYISCTTAHDMEFNNSRILILKASSPNIRVNNCEIDDLEFHWISFSDPFHNISMPRKIVKDSIIRNTFIAPFTIFENTVIGGYKADSHFKNVYNSSNKKAGELYEPEETGNQYNSKNKAFDIRSKREWSNYPNTFNKCTINANILGPGIYNECYIRPVNYFVLFSYSGGLLEDNKFTFSKCKFDIYGISCVDSMWYEYTYKNFGALLDVRDCEFVIADIPLHATTIVGQEFPASTLPTDENFANLLGCYITKFINNKVIFKPINSSTNYNFVFLPYGNTVIKNNLFITSKKVNNTLNIMLFRLYNIYRNNSFRINIEDNIVKYTDNATINFVGIDPKDFVGTVNDTVIFNIKNNVFYPNKTIKKVNETNILNLINLDTKTKNHALGQNITYTHTYKAYSNQNKAEKDIIYYNLYDSKYYKLLETILDEVISVTVSGYTADVTLNGNERLQDVQFVEISSSSAELPTIANIHISSVDPSNNSVVINT